MREHLCATRAELCAASGKGAQSTLARRGFVLFSVPRYDNFQFTVGFST